jgi:hypothetical protein
MTAMIEGRMKRILVAVLGLSLLSISCADPVPPGAPTVGPATTTDVFSGTLLALGANEHQFMVNQIGQIQVTLNSVVPSAAVGVGIGTPSTSTGTCLVLNNMTAVASPGVQMSGTATVTGNFCVEIFDVGNLVEPVNYTVTVFHS